MKIICIDVETTGLDPKTCQLLQAAFVLVDTKDTTTPVAERPSLVVDVLHDLYVGEPYAFSMHTELLRQHDKWKREKAGARPGTPGALTLQDAGAGAYHVIIGKADETLPWYPNESVITGYVRTWLTTVGCTERRPTPAGKNYGTFDAQFLPESTRGLFRHRAYDPGSALVDWAQDGEVLPDLQTLMRRHIDPAYVVKHGALEDARAVADLLLAHINGV